MKKIHMMLFYFALLANLAFADHIQNAIYNYTDNNKWYIVFNGGNWNNVWLWNHNGIMCLNSKDDPIYDNSGCQIESRNVIAPQNQCGGGICITYDSDDSYPVSGTIDITDPCGVKKSFDYIAHYDEGKMTAFIESNGQDTGGIVFNKYYDSDYEEFDGNIAIRSDKCFK